jgi:hypothetical protein
MSRRSGPFACRSADGGRGLLDLGAHHDPEADEQGQDEPDQPGYADVRPLLTGEGGVEDEQAALGELEVDPVLQGAEPRRVGGEQAEQGGEQKGEDEVGVDGADGGADEDAQQRLLPVGG